MEIKEIREVSNWGITNNRIARENALEREKTLDFQEWCKKNDIEIINYKEVE